jgi:uncharacterized membrane protein YfcA
MSPPPETAGSGLADCLRPLLFLAALATAGCVLAAFLFFPQPLRVAGDYGAFTLLGVAGAIFANATGAGGGVVFLPAFGQLGFTEAQAVATSFAIQCFGMTAGATAWSLHYRRHRRGQPEWQAFIPVIALCTVFSVVGLWTTYVMDWRPPSGVKPLFGGFSLLLGVAVLATTLLFGAGGTHRLDRVDTVALAVIAYIGGIVTAWLSVGVGEFVALYLILRRFDVTLSVASAVVISALTVWSATPQHLVFSPAVYWEVVLFAAPGAVVGAVFARYLVLWLGARRLKLLFGAWLLVIGVTELGLLG